MPACLQACLLACRPAGPLQGFRQTLPTYRSENNTASEHKLSCFYWARALQAKGDPFIILCNVDFFRHSCFFLFITIIGLRRPIIGTRPRWRAAAEVPNSLGIDQSVSRGRRQTSKSSVLPHAAKIHRAKTSVEPAAKNTKKLEKSQAARLAVDPRFVFG